MSFICCKKPPKHCKNLAYVYSPLITDLALCTFFLLFVCCFQLFIVTELKCQPKEIKGRNDRFPDSRKGVLLHALFGACGNDTQGCAYTCLMVRSKLCLGKPHFLMLAYLCHLDNYTNYCRT